MPRYTRGSATKKTPNRKQYDQAGNIGHLEVLEPQKMATMGLAAEPHFSSALVLPFAVPEQPLAEPLQPCFLIPPSQSPQRLLPMAALPVASK
jgi:hypothetical protein